jgi:hypothetical protein
MFILWRDISILAGEYISDLRKLMISTFTTYYYCEHIKEQEKGQGYNVLVRYEKYIQNFRGAMWNKKHAIY